MADELGPWDPLRPVDAPDLFAGCQAPWWIGGGWAIDLLIGRPTRDHGDLDVLVLRQHQREVRAQLDGWDVHAADPPGSLRPWPKNETLPAHVHDVWCRPDPRRPWAFQLMIDDVDGDEWLFRRDHRIRRPVSELAGRASTADTPVLTPDVQLLYKSKGRRPKDEADFEAVLPHLTTEERDWLRNALQTVHPRTGHDWIGRLET